MCKVLLLGDPSRIGVTCALEAKTEMNDCTLGLGVSALGNREYMCRWTYTAVSYTNNAHGASSLSIIVHVHNITLNVILFKCQTTPLQTKHNLSFMNT